MPDLDAVEMDYVIMNDEASAHHSSSGSIKIMCNCSTIGCGMNDDDLKFVCETDGGCQKTVELLESGELVTRYACIPEYLYQPSERPVKCHVHRFNQHIQGIGCCKNGSFCAQHLNVQLLPQVNPGVDKNAENKLDHFSGTYILLTVVILIVATVLVGLVYYFYRRKRLCWKTAMKKSQSEFRPFLKSACAGGSTTSTSGDVNNMLTDIEKLFDVDATGSDSGRGPALLVQRSLAHSLELKAIIGRGRYGDVYRACWNSDTVAVKVFASRDEQSWLREVEIFENHMTHHENVLRYYGADSKDNGMSLKHVLVTEYHPSGSLYDFLNRTSVDDTSLCIMVQSIANGLAFLHCDFAGTRYKPCIAHRDVKSKNILVKKDGSCCIADLGLAVRYDSTSGTIDIPINEKVGTKRYLAPEILDNTMSNLHFDNFRRADIYSFGLVIWEISRRTTVAGLQLSYELPYYDMVQPDPTMEEMIKCVCVETKRPTVQSEWDSHHVLREMTRIMRECWAARPDARLTALRVKKSVFSLLPLTSRGLEMNIL